MECWLAWNWDTYTHIRTHTQMLFQVDYELKWYLLISSIGFFTYLGNIDVIIFANRNNVAYIEVRAGVRGQVGYVCFG